MSIKKKILQIVTSCGIGFFALGCEDKNPQDSTAKAINETLRRYSNSPVGESIGPVINAIANVSVIINVEDHKNTNSPNKMFLTANDNEGLLWVYMYTDPKEYPFNKSDNFTFKKMLFTEVFTIIEANDQIGGFFIK